MPDVGSELLAAVGAAGDPGVALRLRPDVRDRLRGKGLPPGRLGALIGLLAVVLAVSRYSKKTA